MYYDVKEANLRKAIYLFQFYDILEKNNRMGTLVKIGGGQGVGEGGMNRRSTEDVRQ